MNLRTFVAAVCAGLVAGASFGSVGSGKGISDISTADRAAAARRGRLTTEVQERNGVGAATDAQIGPKVGSPSTVCDFIGFLQSELVNGAYAGGAGSGGSVRNNLGVSFTGATALNTWNGCCSPDAGIAYSPTGSMVISSSTSTFWRGIDFHYSATVAMTLEVWSGANATGAIIQTVTLPANVPSSAKYSTWTLRQIAFSSIAKSVKIMGAGNRWGIDRLTPLAGCPAPTSAGDDCNGNGQSDACEIAYGLVQDCNGNGKPDSCDLAASPPSDAVQWSVSAGGNGHWYKRVEATDITWQAARQACELLQGHLATVNSSAEQNWLFNQFVNGQATCRPATWAMPRGVWIGLYQDTTSATFSEPAGGWRWVTDEPFTFANWSPGEPNNVDYPANHAGMYGNGAWDDTPNDAGIYCHAGYLVEWDTAISFDCNANGVIDSCEIASGAVADCNGNGIPDTCDIAAGLATDCNANGALDSCELASGSAVDQNGNGIPDTCDPTPTLVLTANAAACNAVGSEVDMEARLSGVLNLVVAGQLVLDWDPSKLELVSSNAGDAPYVSSYLVNNAAGQAVILVSTAQGGSGTTSQSAIVSRLRFRVLGGSCDGSGTSVGFGSFAGALTTTFADGFGTSVVPTLVASSGFVVDDGAPVLSNVPANVSVQAFAGEGGSAFVTLGMPTATDACAPGLTATGVRSDGQALGAAWPSGTTTVTWSATDPCGNTTTATTSVTVDPTNTLDLAVNVGYGYYGAPRTLSLAVLGSMGTQTRSASVSVMWDGSATFSVTDLPVDTYDCVNIEDTARSLRARVSISDTGSVWSAAAANLIQGDVINDEVIDVLDWGAYIVRNANADFNGDGLLNSLDGDVIVANFGKRGDSACGAGSPERAAITAISVSDLVAMGMPELAGADLNGDGMLDTADMELAGN